MQHTLPDKTSRHKGNHKVIAYSAFASGLALVAFSYKAAEWSELLGHALRDVGLLLAAIVSVTLLHEKHLRDELLHQVAEVIDARVDNLRTSARDFVRRVTAKQLQVNDIVMERSSRITSKKHVNYKDVSGKQYKIFVVGVSCCNLLNTSFSDVRAALASGADFRFVLTNPDAQFLGHYDIGMDKPADAGKMRSEITSSLDVLGKWAAERCKVKVKLYDGIPMYSATWLDDGREGRIYVEFFTYNGAPDNRPCLEFREHKTPELYQRFVQSLERLWEAANPHPSQGDGDRPIRQP